MSVRGAGAQVAPAPPRRPAALGCERPALPPGHGTGQPGRSQTSPRRRAHPHGIVDWGLRAALQGPTPNRGFPTRFWVPRGPPGRQARSLGRDRARATVRSSPDGPPLTVSPILSSAGRCSSRASLPFGGRSAQVADILFSRHRALGKSLGRGRHFVLGGRG
ncbi:hypothetical protein NDU88_003044 [Pleurodeles waltl]|uniref:Uncharacterized protein n=1 Tax=Pleurodeles waltl TaxID=8319 RepID=A0AAV7QAP2_PLEWA|nr:hypothetical protein NDU88_003044 [Pleurodeles waltl]